MITRQLNGWVLLGAAALIAAAILFAGFNAQSGGKAYASLIHDEKAGTVYVVCSNGETNQTRVYPTISGPAGRHDINVDAELKFLKQFQKLEAEVYHYIGGSGIAGINEKWVYKDINRFLFIKK
jgi:hypothetical protein